MNVHNEQMEALLNVLRNCVSNYNNYDNDLSYVDSLISIYQQDDFRHLYNMLSQFLEREIMADQRDHLPTVIERAMEVITNRIENAEISEMSPDELEIINEKLSKLLDHIILEGIRLNRMEAVQRISDKNNQLFQKITEQEEQNKKISDNIKMLDEKVNGFNSQSITILSIFAGLVLVFSSGIELFSQTFSNLNEMNSIKICIYLLVIGMILFDIVFMMFYVVSKISHIDISTSKPNSKKVYSKYFFCRLRQRYPYVFWFNTICFILILLMLRILYMTITYTKP